MLVSLTVNNFAIVKSLDVEWFSGFSAITGETGAGKSIAVDALSFCLGARSDTSKIRPGTEIADVRAMFDVSKIPNAKTFLLDNNLDDGEDCLISRTINESGRSKALINGKLVNLSLIKELRQHLVFIHGQNEHQLLGSAEYQCTLLDNYANNLATVRDVGVSHRIYKELMAKKNLLLSRKLESDAREKLLRYQIEELNDFALQDGEYLDVEKQHKTLTNAEALISAANNAVYALSDSESDNAYDIVQSITSSLKDLSDKDSSLSHIANSLSEVCIQIEEASSDLRRYSERLDVNDELLSNLDKRLAQTHSLARKHLVSPGGLYGHHLSLLAQLEDITSGHSELVAIDSKIDYAKMEYTKLCKELSETRISAAKTLQKTIEESIQGLAMPHAVFEISVTQNSDYTSHGCDDVTFMLSANKGQPLQPLTQVASGGELSRISLAIQVILASTTTTPTLIFDEVDVGISGSTAAIVGKMLRNLGKYTQVISITHLPQVASFSHNQYRVVKSNNESETVTNMKKLDSEERIEEIARLLGGETIDTHSLNNAKSLLEKGASL